MSARKSTTNTSTKSSKPLTKSPKKPVNPFRKSRSTGSSNVQPFPPSSSARATNNNSAPTSVRSDGNLPPNKLPNSTQPAPRQSPIRTGINVDFLFEIL